MMSPERKKQLMEEFAQGSNDTGSIELQVAMLTERINELNKHFERHSHDYASRVGLMKLVGQRRRFLRYLQHKSSEGYKSLIKRLGLRG